MKYRDGYITAINRVKCLCAELAFPDLEEDFADNGELFINFNELYKRLDELLGE